MTGLGKSGFFALTALVLAQGTTLCAFLLGATATNLLPFSFTLFATVAASAAAGILVLKAMEDDRHD